MDTVIENLMQALLALIAVLIPIIAAYVAPAAKAALKATESSKWALGLETASPVLYASVHAAAEGFLKDAADEGVNFAESDLIPAVKKFAEDEAAALRFKTGIKIGDTSEAIDALVKQAVDEARRVYKAA